MNQKQKKKKKKKKRFFSKVEKHNIPKIKISYFSVMWSS